LKIKIEAHSNISNFEQTFFELWGRSQKEILTRTSLKIPCIYIYLHHYNYSPERERSGKVELSDILLQESRKKIKLFKTAPDNNKRSGKTHKNPAMNA
jgi:hypothetical protein